MAMAAKEFTWGGELSKTKNEIEWNPVEEEDEDDEEMLLTHCLFLKQAMLGDDAKEGERNIIEVETRNWNNKKICQPFLSLKLGLNESCPLDLTLLPPVKLRLKSGTGPVYLMGTHAMEIEDDEDYFGDSSFDYETPERMKSKKRRGSAANNSSVTNGSAKKRKVENGTDEDDEEDKNKDESSAEGEDDVDDNEDEEDEDDDEEEDGEEDGDEDEEEDEEDEDEEESMEDDEEEESPEKPKKKIPKGKQNGHSKEMMNGSAKKKGKKGKKNSLDEIKKEISQSSGTKHKKEDKFTNMVRSKYHMTDAKKLQDLWSWYKSAQLAK